MSKKITITLTVIEGDKFTDTEYGSELSAIEGMMEDLMSDGEVSEMNTLLREYGYQVKDYEVKEL